VNRVVYLFQADFVKEKNCPGRCLLSVCSPLPSRLFQECKYACCAKILRSVTIKVCWDKLNWYRYGLRAGGPGFDSRQCRVKRQGREANHSPPFSAEVKRRWTYAFTPLYVFMAQCLTLPFFAEVCCIIADHSGRAV
jgi:hypothetical protein